MPLIILNMQSCDVFVKLLHQRRLLTTRRDVTSPFFLYLILLTPWPLKRNGPLSGPFLFQILVSAYLRTGVPVPVQVSAGF
jgi:hypothetical protein